jgi:AraC-like DNA-binding protein
LRDAYQVISGCENNSGVGHGQGAVARTVSRIVEPAVRYIEENYTTPLTLDEVANANAMSRFHFSRVFKLKTGLSFKKFLNRTRIKAAKSLMREEEMNVTEACFAVGFNDLSYFTRVFRVLEGVTPSSYRKGLSSTSRLSRLDR